jgi:hypothetical protein
MPWYRTGTVAITAGSTTVTGTGTQFAQNSRVGDAFQGPDGNWYEVTNIASATVLSILPAYKGTTVTGGAYGLAPMQGYVKQSADQLRTITNQYGTTLGLIGSPSDIAGLRANISAAKSGVNSDITQLTGLTVPLGTTMGGTGGNTPAAARAALGIGEAGRLAYSNGFLIGDTTRPFDDQQAVRVADSVFASRARSGFYATSTSGVNIDTVPPGWCGLVTSTGSNNTGTFPSFASSGFFYLMTQGTYVNSASTQIALRYGANSTSGTNLNPTMAIRTRNAPGTAWGPWGIVQTDQDLVSSLTDTTAGKIVTTGHMGWGTASSPRTTDFNTQSAGGFYSSATNTTNAPITSAFVAATLPYGSTAYGQIAMATSGTVVGNRMFFRNTSSGNATPWKEITTRNDINGTVAGTYANPTGALIERGGNANGNYVKYADGTMICWRNMSDTVAIATSLLGGFRSDNITWTYPVPFVESPTVQACARASAFSMYAAPSAAVGGVFTEAIYNYVTVTTSASFVRYGSVMAIGRWAA